MTNSRRRPKLYARLILFSLLGFLALAVPLRAQQQEVTFSLGGIAGQTRGFNSPAAGQADLSADKTFGVNYGYRLVNAKLAVLFGELEFAAIPNRGVISAKATVAQNYASLYAVPGFRVKFFPGARLSPWGAVGGGYALYQESAQLSNGQTTTNRFLNRGVVDFGGGLDLRVFRFIGLRAEVRDFYSGNPNVNVRLNPSAQHNVVSSAGLIFRF